MKKKLITAAITCVIIGVLTFLAIKFGSGTEEEVKKMDIFRFNSDIDTELQTIQNGKVKLEFDPVTTLFTFTDANGKQWKSCPDAAVAAADERVMSLLYLEYKNGSGVKMYLNSYEHSVAKGNYTYEKVDDSTIRIDFSIGLMAKTYIIPSVMPEERFQQLREMVDDEAKKCLRDWYRTLDPEKLKKDEEKWKTYSEKYPDLLEGIKVYELYDSLKNYQKEKLENIFKEQCGYTNEDYEKDNEYGMQENEEKLLPNINLSMFLKLEDDSLVAEIPYNTIQFYEAYPVTEIRILPFFCGADTVENGYLFVPDGSGAYINFNNQKLSQSSYSANMYGWDYGQKRDIIIADPIARFPVYGASYTDRNAALLAMIEAGDTYSKIEADVAGKTYKFNYVTNVFSVVHNQIADIGGRSISAVYMFEKSLPKDEKISVRYKGVKSSSYVEMAKTYREYLTGRYEELAQKVEKTSLPTAVELLGAVAKIQHVLGFPKELPYTLTTYAEMEKLVKSIHDSGWEDVNVVLNGWFNDGIDHDWPDDIDLIGRLGSKKSFKSLLSTAKGYGYSVAGKADFTFVKSDTLFDSFQAKQDASRFLSREVAKFQEVSKIWYGQIDDGDVYYLAKPEYSMKALEAYRKDAKSLGIENIAFASIGNALGANYHRKKTVSRQAVMEQQVKKLAELKNNDTVIYKGNLYALPYADIVLDFPIASDKASIEDGALPFFEIALHGYIRYTGDSINITNDYITNLLKSAETGAGLYFIFMEATADELQESKYTNYYGANYNSWKDEANVLYNRYKDDFGALTAETIENHERLAENVYCTTYSNGTKVYVNYRVTEYKADDITIPAQDWVVKKGGN
ncbi:MAG: DUF5696 domain-containing protein [Lachnospiraceae bacterium]|nr:DUF5696 domain-containing protein [Lachnospiraceae bacterium]